MHGQLSHRNTVPVYHSDCMDGTPKQAPSFTMPFIDIGVRVVAMDSTLTVDQLNDPIFVKKKSA